MLINLSHYKYKQLYDIKQIIFTFFLIVRRHRVEKVTIFLLLLFSINYSLSPMSNTQLYKYVGDYFSRTMPEPRSELNYNSPFELLVAVILSAQCTDKRVNIVTPALFKALPTAEAMSASTPEEIFGYIGSISYPNAKSTHLHSMATTLVERFSGTVPNTREELESLSGVGRKTANVILSVIFGQGAFAVDTHVFRVAARIGLSQGAKTPLATELQLVEGFSSAGFQDSLGDAHHWLILHGRYTCTARKPKCEKCGLTSVCNHFLNGNA